MKPRLVVGHDAKPLRSVKEHPVSIVCYLSESERRARVRDQARAALARYRARQGLLPL